MDKHNLGFFLRDMSQFARVVIEDAKRQDGKSGDTDPRKTELEKGVANWNLLLQIDSEEDKTGMMWGDAGRLYFWIKEQDLNNLDFDKSWFVLQCY